MLALEAMVVLLLSGLVTSAGNSSSVHTRQTRVSCQTSNGSPRTEDVTPVINQV